MRGSLKITQGGVSIGRVMGEVSRWGGGGVRGLEDAVGYFGLIYKYFYSDHDPGLQIICYICKRIFARVAEPRQAKGSRKKVIFFYSGPVTKALTAPPPSRA